MNDFTCCIEFLTLITGRKQRAALVHALSEAGGRLIKIVYGKGSVQSNYLLDMFGLAPEENKVVVTCLLPHDKAEAVLQMLIDNSISTSQTPASPLPYPWKSSRFDRGGS